MKRTIVALSFVLLAGLIGAAIAVILMGQEGADNVAQSAPPAASTEIAQPAPDGAAVLPSHVLSE